MHGIVTLPTDDARDLHVEQWSDDLARSPVVLHDVNDSRVTVRMEAVAPSAVPLNLEPIPGTPGLRVFRRGIGPIEVVASLSSHIALRVALSGVDASEAVRLSMSIPLIGSPELFEAPKDSEWDGALGDEQSIKSLIGHDLDVTAFTADHGGGFDLDWSQGGHWGVFHSSWADGATLREYAAQASKPVLVHDSDLPMVVGMRENVYTQVMWFQRHRFWHLIENSPTGVAIGHAMLVSGAIGV